MEYYKIHCRRIKDSKSCVDSKYSRYSIHYKSQPEVSSWLLMLDELFHWSCLKQLTIKSIKLPYYSNPVIFIMYIFLFEIRRNTINRNWHTYNWWK